MIKTKRNRAEHRSAKFKMNLHLFGHDGTGGDDAGAEGGNGSGTEPGSEPDGKGGSAGGQKQTFDDVLKDKDYQAEFDRRVQKAIDTAKSKWDALMDDKLSEAEKLARMNKEEKAEYLRQKREKELTDRETAITRRELMAEAKNTLAEKKLPAELAEILNYTDADTCKKSLETVEKAFQKAVQSAVEERLKGGKPPKRAGSEQNEYEGIDAATVAQVEALM